ncbi:hypothetical protein [Paramagnetospirillum magneticum]|uniref:Lipoprotein n=1 Tax=Paramagnetospirillum magneticum (strain ATCC 700264 / AMB-1) TaxID=342108 RepID=Q2WA53_PARM1|nr:hypothetical protein [Paramagnetospirillum magneticum]BAE49272.1 hypothetical protein amb0468 [Paramagnetospirillum magneticum AMB-1]
MRKVALIAASLAAALTLSACDTARNAVEAAKPKTSAQAVWEARALFDAGPLNAAAAYARLPACASDGQAKAPCAKPEVVGQLSKAATAALAAFDAAEATVRANPQTDADLALAGTVNAVQAVKTILDTYGIK